MRHDAARLAVTVPNLLTLLERECIRLEGLFSVTTTDDLETRVKVWAELLICRSLKVSCRA